MAAARVRSGSPAPRPATRQESTDVVSLSFRRGFDQIVVLRLKNVPGYPQEWADPLATGEGIVDRPEQVVLSRGALSGVEADILVVPRNIPHL